MVRPDPIRLNAVACDAAPAVHCCCHKVDKKKHRGVDGVTDHTTVVVAVVDGTCAARVLLLRDNAVAAVVVQYGAHDKDVKAVAAVAVETVIAIAACNVAAAAAVVVEPKRSS